MAAGAGDDTKYDRMNSESLADARVLTVTLDKLRRLVSTVDAAQAEAERLIADAERPELLEMKEETREWELFVKDSNENHAKRAGVPVGTIDSITA